MGVGSCVRVCVCAAVRVLCVPACAVCVCVCLRQTGTARCIRHQIKVLPLAASRAARREQEQNRAGKRFRRGSGFSFAPAAQDSHERQRKPMYGCPSVPDPLTARSDEPLEQIIYS